MISSFPATVLHFFPRLKSQRFEKRRIFGWAEGMASWLICSLLEWRQTLKVFISHYLEYAKLIHEADQVITIFARVVCTSVLPYVRPHFSKPRITKQLSSEKRCRCWRDCGSGPVDHWWHTCLVWIVFVRVEFTLWFSPAISNIIWKTLWCVTNFSPLFTVSSKILFWSTRPTPYYSHGPVVLTLFYLHMLFVRSLFKKKEKSQLARTLGLAERIIDDSYFVFPFSSSTEVWVGRNAKSGERKKDKNKAHWFG